ncbi:MAG: DNA polymerase III subunit gamma/tau [Bacteroidales bacterium]|nr:DNA polymerase III subunit gamma/tau [Bacteroidales bacterium]MDY5781595.1 DNA polymerase III subunit gamma/tau [Candidatus Cryptobacteroides sp.]
MSDSQQYIVSARKYRPDSFEDLIGQDNIVKTLKNSIIRGKLAHAYLFCGPRGVGKTSAARIFAKIINCSNPSEDMEPCGQCESCVSFREGRSYCIHELDAASNNGVDDIKALMDQVQIPPQVGRYSVYIIDEVHMLTQAAFNSFLKTLEEPPAHAIFILATTEKHKILPTILSRCQTYDFNRISIPDIVKNLRAIASKEDIHVDDESLHIIARKADGAMRDALTIFDQTVAFCGNDVKYEDVIRNLNVLDYEHCFHLTESMLANDYPSALLEFDSVLSKGFNALYFVASLSTHFRNLMVAKTGSLDALLELPDSLKKKYREQAEKCPLQFLYDALSVTVQCETGYKESINPRLHIEFALMKLCFLTGGEVSLRPVQAAVAAKAPGAAKAPAAGDAKVQTPEPAGPDHADASPAKPAEGENVAGVAEVSRPTRRRTTRSSAAALSLGSIGDNEGPKTETAPEIPDDARIPTDEEIMAKWKCLPEQFASRPRLASTLATAKVEIVEMDGYKRVDFFLMNLSQKKWVEENLLHNIEGILWKMLNTNKLRLNPEVMPEEAVEKKIYLAEDKAKIVADGNEEVRNLVHDLGLDVK